MTVEPEAKLTTTRKQIEKENELRAAYRRKFGGEDCDTKAVILDLEDVCYLRDPVYDGKGSDPATDAIHRDGMRAVALHIKTMATAKPLDEETLLKEIMQNEE